MLCEYTFEPIHVYQSDVYCPDDTILGHYTKNLSSVKVICLHPYPAAKCVCKIVHTQKASLVPILPFNSHKSIANLSLSWKAI